MKETFTVKKIISAAFVLTLLATTISPALSVSVGNDVEYIPASRRLGVGVIDPAAKLEINGQIMITGGTPATGKVLTTDGSGLATWETTSVLGSNVTGTVLNATNATNISGGTITNSTFINGTINGATLINVTLPPVLNAIVSKLVAPDGNPNPAASVDNGGNLGVGETSPISRLTVKSDLTRVVTTNFDNPITTGFVYHNFQKEGIDKFWFSGHNDGETFAINSAGNGAALVASRDRKVSIGGGFTPTATLQVGGNDATLPVQTDGVDDLFVADDVEVIGTVFAGNFVGNGSGLTGITNIGNASTANTADFATSAGTATLASGVTAGMITNSTFTGGTINGASLLNVVIDPSTHNHSNLNNPNTSAVVLVVDSDSDVGIGESAPTSKLHITGENSTVTAQHTEEDKWSEFRTAGVDGSGNLVKKWSVGSTGDTRPTSNGGQDKFYVFQYTDNADAAVNTYRMVITPEGNVGFGENNPTEKLEVAGNVKAINFIGNGAGLTGIVAAGSANADAAKTLVSPDLSITVASTTNGGNLGVGTSIPSAKLHVAGDVRATNFIGNGAGLTNVTAVAPPQYDSGWFAVSRGNAYPKTNTLGVIPYRVQMLYSPNASGSPAYIVSMMNSSWHNGYNVAMTASLFTIRTGNNSLAVFYAGTSAQAPASGFYRMYAWGGVIPAVPPGPTPPGPSDNLGCSPDGFYHVTNAETSVGGTGKSFGHGPSSADFAQCDQVTWEDGGHSVTRTWTLASPVRSGDVVFKVEKRRNSGDSTGSGLWYWYQSNVDITNHNQAVAYRVANRNADITLNCTYSKPSNQFTCTIAKVVL